MDNRQQNQRGGSDGQVSAVRRAAVTNNDDPTQPTLYRHTLTPEARAGQSNIAPASRTACAPYWKPPAYPIGSIVMVQAYDNDPHNSAMGGIELNKVNQAPPCNDPVKDDSRRIPGDKILVVNGEERTWVEGGIKIYAGQSEVTIAPDGVISIKGSEVVVEAPNISAVGNLTVYGDTELAGKTTVNGVEVCTTNGQDSRGDTFDTSGQ